MSLGFESGIVIAGFLIFLCLLSFSVYLNIKLGMTILKFEDSVEDCLDIIDEKYASISKVLEIPIFFDSVEVRQVINDIVATRESLLVIANKLSENDASREEEKVS